MTKDICKQTGSGNRVMSICRSYLQRTQNWSLVSSLFRVGHALTVQQVAANLQHFFGQVDKRQAHYAVVQGEPGLQGHLQSMDMCLMIFDRQSEQVWMSLMPGHAAAKYRA